MNTAPTCQFTEADFCKELSRFRQLCGEKTFWARPVEQRNAVLSGLGFLYLNLGKDDGSLPTQEQIERWGAWFQNALENYNRRAMLMGVEV